MAARSSSSSSTPGACKSLWCFDPVSDLPNDLAAFCLSFIDVRTLLLVAQRVSPAWFAAIDGGLPAVWQTVALDDTVYDLVAQVVRKGRGSIQSLRVDRPFFSYRSLFAIRPLSGLRRLVVSVRRACADQCSPVLSCLPNLEECEIACAVNVMFPSLPVLTSLRCHDCHSIAGLRNLPALTKLVFDFCSGADDGAWPASLRAVSIHSHQTRVVKHVAALQQLHELQTDWSFAFDDSQAGNNVPVSSDQLSFHANFTTLQRFALINLYLVAPTIALGCVANLISLREIELVCVEATDQQLQCLSQLTSLESLSLMQIPTITSECFHHFSSLPILTSLLIKLCTKITDYSPVATCTRLRKLIVPLWGCSFQDRYMSPALISRAEVQAICRLQHLQHLETGLADPASFSHICGMRSLRKLAVWVNAPIPSSSLAALPSLALLESLDLYGFPAVTDEQVPDLTCCLVRVSTLRHITLHGKRYGQVWSRASRHLRNALPRLETCEQKHPFGDELCERSYSYAGDIACGVVLMLCCCVLFVCISVLRHLTSFLF